MDVLEKIGEFYGLSGDLTRNNFDFYNAVFDKIDFDGDGDVTHLEIYKALTSAGLDITKEGVMRMGMEMASICIFYLNDDGWYLFPGIIILPPHA